MANSSGRHSLDILSRSRAHIRPAPARLVRDIRQRAPCGHPIRDPAHTRGTRDSGRRCRRLARDSAGRPRYAGSDPLARLAVLVRPRPLALLPAGSRAHPVTRSEINGAVRARVTFARERFAIPRERHIVPGGHVYGSSDGGYGRGAENGAHGRNHEREPHGASRHGRRDSMRPAAR
jgi:hypothetical protein